MSVSGKNVIKICDTAGTGTQPAFQFQLGFDVGGVHEVEITATGSVTLEGRLSPDAPWAQIAGPTTSPGASSLLIQRAYPEMRANVTANTGTIRVWVMA